MTPRQRSLLDFVASYQDEHGYSPTYQEIAQHIGLASKSGVRRMVESLLARGYLRMEGGYAARRALVVVEPSLAVVPTAALVAELKARGVTHG